MRTLVLILALLNALFFCWARGWLDDIAGIKAQGDREPERMARQLHPERIQLLGPQAAASVQARSCLELGPLDSEEAAANAQAALTKAGIAANQWQLQTTELPGAWAVATIRMTSKDFQARKEETYKKMKISYEFLQGPPEEQPSLVLSRFPDEKAAKAELDSLEKRALKGLRVLQLQAPGKRHSLVFPRADGVMQAKLRNLGDAAFAAGFKACGSRAPAVAAPTAPAASAAASAASAP